VRGADGEDAGAVDAQGRGRERRSTRNGGPRASSSQHSSKGTSFAPRPVSLATTAAVPRRHRRRPASHPPHRGGGDIIWGYHYRRCHRARGRRGGGGSEPGE